jgi:Reverse transcriptase (RNA-dependent DNA polymerase)/RNase H-like domain found in reverse transcriptase
MIFGLPWFKEYNPLIDWNTGKVRILKNATKHVEGYMEKKARRNRDLKNLETANIQTKTTNVSLPLHQEKRLRKQTEKSSHPLSHPLGERQEARRSNSPDWRKRIEETITKRKDETEVEEKNTKARNTIVKEKRTKVPKTIIEEEVDEELYKTHTLNPAGTHETVIVQRMENKNDQEDDLLVSYIGQENPDDIWVRAKTNLAMDLAIEESAKRKEQTIEEMIPQTLMKYRSVFDKDAANRFPERRPWDHAIDLQTDFIPKKAHIYPLSLPEQEKLEEFVTENLEKGYIRPSKSPQASPFFFVKKKDGKLRPVQDYRLLNEKTVKNAYPLPLISDLVDQLKGAKYFTKLDVRWGYNNVRLKEGDEWKAAFVTKFGLFEPTVMFFGLCNSPATFQTMMNEIFQDMIHKRWIIIYMDDIFIFTKTIEENVECVKKVLQRLRDNDLYLKPEKCTFWTKEVEYLGMIISENQLQMDPVKLKGIAEWPAPANVKNVRSFLGFGNYYRRFIHNYGNITRPLNDLLGKNKTFEWSQECQETFNLLKKKFQESPVLLMPDMTKPFVVEADASKYASGAVLRQQDNNGDWHPCAYLSKSFNPTERNYEIYDRELLVGIITSCYASVTIT